MRRSNRSSLVVKPIGTILTKYTDRSRVPIQPRFSTAMGRVRVDRAYADGLDDIEGFSHIILVYWFHRVKQYRLRVTPFLDSVPRGLFATRAPWRPNPIGISIVQLIRRSRNMLYVKGVDVFNRTPLLDIKPYVPPFDFMGRMRIGWLSGKVR